MGALCACDHVDSDDRYIEMPGVEAKRTVLLEEFTGQRCSNCPEAHRTIEQLKEQFGENLIPVSIHAGNFALAATSSSLPERTFLGQPEGEEYNKHWNIDQWPMGGIDRQGSKLEVPAWAASIRSRIEQTSPLEIEVKAEIMGDEIRIETKLHATTADVAGKLQLWVLEDGIVAMQQDGGDVIPDYVHNHVLRAAVNGTWGEEIRIAKHQYSDVAHSIATRCNEHEIWNLENLSVVAFVYNDGGVVQAAITKVDYDINKN